MLEIGFANIYYTLWEVNDKKVYHSNGIDYDIYTEYTYLQNISKDKETALSKYPDAPFDPDLRGRTQSFRVRRRQVWDTIDCYRFGRDEGLKISADEDAIWYFNNMQKGGDWKEHADYVRKLLLDAGYGERYIESRDQFYDERDWTRETEWKTKIEKTVNYVRQLPPEFDIVIPSNPNSDGEVRIDGTDDPDIEFVIQFICPMKELYYQGYEYYLPTKRNKKGEYKAVRVKNKEMHISKWHLDAETDADVNQPLIAHSLPTIVIDACDLYKDTPEEREARDFESCTH